MIGYKNITFRITSHNSTDSAKELEHVITDMFPNSNITFTDYLGPVFSIHIGKKGYDLNVVAFAKKYEEIFNHSTNRPNGF